MGRDMEETRPIAVSPRHTVLLAIELFPFIEKAPREDFVVQTRAHREANGLPLMMAELVIAGEETRRAHAAAQLYPFHFRKTYFPGRLHGDPQVEYERQLRASQLCGTPPPIGFGANVFRSCLIPGQSYARLSPFGGEPPENNITKAQKLPLASAAGLWRLAEETLAQHQRLNEGGLAHGDAELHNLIVCPAPLEPILIDFEAAVERAAVDEAAWTTRCKLDLEPLLREAVYLQCALGQQASPLGVLSFDRMKDLFRAPERFQRAIETQAEV
ncbi:MAG: hypothetical protein JWM82_1260 [Myxococcales bacterium]|nr:hypothetical protein [Myxococcales bacterium]